MLKPLGYTIEHFNWHVTGTLVPTCVETIVPYRPRGSRAIFHDPLSPGLTAVITRALPPPLAATVPPVCRLARRCRCGPGPRACSTEEDSLLCINCRARSKPLRIRQHSGRPQFPARYPESWIFRDQENPSWSACQRRRFRVNPRRDVS
jgi:hypothetical protein